jgi:2-oxoglutarate ferredoxin oxidoreductase subunit gamma
VRHPTAALVMNRPSFEKYASLVKPQGVLIRDSSLIPESANRADIQELALPAKEIATELGAPQIANVVMLGALAQATGVVALETLDRVLQEHLSARHQHMLEANRRALQRGAQYAMVKVVA